MGKIDKAIKKINTEIQKKPYDRYQALVGEHIIDCITTEMAADAVLSKDKTLSGALKEIWDKASLVGMAQQSTKTAVIEDAVVYKWAREYFGLTETADPQTSAEAPKKGVCIKLEDFF